MRTFIIEVKFALELLFLLTLLLVTTVYIYTITGKRFLEDILVFLVTQIAIILCVIILEIVAQIVHLISERCFSP